MAYTHRIQPRIGLTDKDGPFFLCRQEGQDDIRTKHHEAVKYPVSKTPQWLNPVLEITVQFCTETKYSAEMTHILRRNNNRHGRRHVRNSKHRTFTTDILYPWRNNKLNSGRSSQENSFSMIYANGKRRRQNLLLHPVTYVTKNIWNMCVVCLSRMVVSRLIIYYLSTLD